MTNLAPKILLASLAPFVLAATPAAAAGDTGQVLTAAVEGFIRPGYQHLHEEADTAEKTLSALCARPAEDNLEAARQSFGTLVEAWSEIEIIRFGPVIDDNRLERILYFPDRRGIGLKQVQAALAEQDETATDLQSLAAKSVALQGLTTLEFLLYGTDAEKLASGDEYRCHFAETVAGRISQTAAELDDAWSSPDGIARHFSKPDPANADFRTTEESLQALLGVFVNSTELIEETRLKPFLGADAAGAKPKLALFWRSGLTATALSGNIEGLKKLYEASDIISLVTPDIARYGKSAMFELSNAQAVISKIGMPLGEAAADPEKRDAANYPRIALVSVRDTFNGHIATGLGLQAGFSAADGD